MLKSCPRCHSRVSKSIFCSTCGVDLRPYLKKDAAAEKSCKPKESSEAEAERKKMEARKRGYYIENGILRLYCRGEVDIVVPDIVTSIDEHVFKSARVRPESITIPKSVTSIHESAFTYRRENLKTITVEKGNPVYHSSDNCLIETASKTLILGCQNSLIPRDGSVTSIGDRAFAHCEGLTSIRIPSGVTSIGDNAFVYCEGLTSVCIANSVTDIGDNAFAFCKCLTSIVIPDSVTSIGDAVFSHCEALTCITVKNGNPVYYSIDNCLIEVASKTLITGLQNSVIPTDGSVISIGKCAFEGCKGLVSMKIPESVTSIGGGAFAGCEELTSIVIPESVTSIGSGAFTGCKALTSIIIPESVKSIGNGAFASCKALTSIVIPESVTSIGRFAFHGCDRLDSITLPQRFSSQLSYLGVDPSRNRVIYT